MRVAFWGMQPGARLHSRREHRVQLGERLPVMTLLYFPTSAGGRLSPDCSHPPLSWWGEALAPVV